MATIVLLHAHPDDESITTGGTIARAVAEGHRAVIVLATGGEYGETPDDLADGESLAARRATEAERSALALGAQRVAFLGYTDSGMTGWEQNQHDGAFVRASVDEAAARLAEILRDEQADVLTGYDWHGNYGHPDHIQVHRVARRAAELSGVRLVEATMNRDAVLRFAEMARAADPDAEAFDPNQPADDGNPMGEPESAIAWQVDVSAFVGPKRTSIAAHRSQVSDSSFFLEMPDEAFAATFGTEWFVEPGVDGPPRSTWFL